MLKSTKMINPHSKRRKIVREYTNVPLLIRKLFDIPEDEMIVRFEWDRNLGRLKIETLLDWDKEIDI